MRILAAIFAGLLAVLGAPTPAPAAYPGSAITFVRDGDVWLSIGTVSYPVTNGGGASWPRLSPAGREIAFVHGGDIWIADTSTLPVGVPLRRLTAGAQAGGPAWSPDGAWIAYRSGDMQTGAVYKVAAHGSPETLLIKAFSASLTEDWSPLQVASTVAWSPDGRYLAFPGGTCGAINDDCLTVLDLVTGRERTAASYGGGGVEISGYATTPAWSEDSRYLYFTQQTGMLNAGPLQIMEFDREKRVARQIGLDGDSSPAPLGQGRFVVSTGNVLTYLQPGGLRTIIAEGTQPHAAY